MKNKIFALLLISLFVFGCQKKTSDNSGKVTNNPNLVKWEQARKELAGKKYTYRFNKEQNKLLVNLQFMKPHSEKGYHFIPATQMVYLLQKKLLTLIKQEKILKDKIILQQYDNGLIIEVEGEPGLWFLRVATKRDMIERAAFNEWLTWSEIKTSANM